MLRATVARNKKRKGFLSTKKIIIFGGISILLIIIYGATFYAQMKACDEALSTVHESYEAKLGKVKEDLRAQLQLKDEALEAAKIKILDIEKQQKNAAGLEPTEPPPLSRDEFNARIVNETFRRFNNIPWAKPQFTDADRQKLRDLWEDIKPRHRAQFDEPLSRAVIKKLQKQLQKFYKAMKVDEFNSLRYDAHAPKFFLNRANKEMDLLALARPIQDLEHKFQTHALDANSTLAALKKLFLTSDKTSALAGFLLNKQKVVKDSHDLDYYYEYNYYDGAYMDQMHAETQAKQAAAKRQAKIAAMEIPKKKRRPSAPKQPPQRPFQPSHAAGPPIQHPVGPQSRKKPVKPPAGPVPMNKRNVRRHEVHDAFRR